MGCRCISPISPGPSPLLNDHSRAAERLDSPRMYLFDPFLDNSPFPFEVERGRHAATVHGCLYGEQHLEISPARQGGKQNVERGQQPMPPLMHLGCSFHSQSLQESRTMVKERRSKRSALRLGALRARLTYRVAICISPCEPLPTLCLQFGRCEAQELSKFCQEQSNNIR